MESDYGDPYAGNGDVGGDAENRRTRNCEGVHPGRSVTESEIVAREYENENLQSGSYENMKQNYKK